MHSSPPRDGRLDALRGLAALLVLACHAAVALVPGAGTFTDHVFNLGHVGVVVFFLVSGMIIPQSARHGLRVFLIRRFFRLYPIYWVSVLLSGAAVPVLLVNLTMLQAFVRVPNALSVYWTLAVELLFYSSVVALRRLDPRHVCLAFIVLAAIVDGYSLLFPIPYLTYLAICWCGAAWHTRHRWALAWLVVLLNASPRFVFYQWHTVLPTAIGVVIVLMSPRIRPPRVAAWVGLASYSLYVFHPIIFAHTPPPLWAPLLVLVAVAGYALIERPCIAVGRQLTR